MTAELQNVTHDRPAAVISHGRLHSAVTLLGYLAVAALPALLTADLLVAMARGWRVDSQVDTIVVWALAAWLIATALLAALPAGRRFLAHFCPQLVLAGGSLCVAWIVAEMALRPILARVDPFHCRRPNTLVTFRPQPGILRGVGPLAHARMNAWGARGDDPPPRDAAFRILCVGGSSTACNYLDDASTWPNLLGEDLRMADPTREYWVGSIGVPSYASRHHLEFIDRSPLVDEVDCLVVQVGINDFMACLAGPRPQPLWTRSRVRQLVRTLAQQYAASGAQVEDAAGQGYLRRRQTRAAAPIARELPNLDACLQSFAADIRQIIEACRRRHVRVVFTTQPVLWKADLDPADVALLWFGRLGDGRFLAVDQLRRGMDRFNQTLTEVCRASRAELVDLDALNGDPGLFYDDCHFTELGAQQVARRIADHFAAHAAVDKTGAAR